MILTSTNIDKVLHDNAYLLVARIGDDWNLHQGKIHPHETVIYHNTVTFSDVGTMVNNLETMQDDDEDTVTVALVRQYPNRTSAQYVVKFGEVL